MKNKEEIITLWFNMWLEKKDLGIDRIFSKNILYTESWGPEYRGIEKIKLWFYEWNSRADVLAWDIKQFFHKDNQTIVEWYFKFKEKNEEAEDFSGVSLIEWTEDGKIENLKEFMFFNTDFLKSEEIYLKLEKVLEGNQEKNYVPAYHFCFKKNL